MNKFACMIAAVLLLGGSGARAQGFPPGDSGERRQPRDERRAGHAWAQIPPSEDRGDRQMSPGPPKAPGLGRTMEEILFAPDLVMRNQRAIGLRDDQQEAIRAEMQKAMMRFTDLQWQQSAQVETLETLCRKQPADEKAVLAQFDKLLSIEGEIKRLNFASLVRVKNILTPEQQARLRELDRQSRPRPDDQQRRPGGNPGPGGMPPGGPGR